MGWCAAKWGGRAQRGSNDNTIIQAKCRQQHAGGKDVTFVMEDFVMEDFVMGDFVMGDKAGRLLYWFGPGIVSEQLQDRTTPGSKILKDLREQRGLS